MRLMKSGASSSGMIQPRSFCIVVFLAVEVDRGRFKSLALGRLALPPDCLWTKRPWHSTIVPQHLNHGDGMANSDGSKVQRRLAAILAADVVGFSTLMGQDEEGTLERVKSLRRDVIEPRVEAHQGRVVKITGDGFLIEFSSPVEAVRCAREVQEALAAKDPQEPNQALQVRIGINLGDIIIEGDGDIYGDGVNVAARLEQIAEPGSIWVSGKVYEEVRDKLPYGFKDRGEQQVKNISRPVRIYSLFPHPDGTRSDLAAKALPILPEKPSIAVLPFTNLSGDREQDYFADGITEDIITELFTYKRVPSNSP